jgi:hypothetical protein
MCNKSIEVGKANSFAQMNYINIITKNRKYLTELFATGDEDEIKKLLDATDIHHDALMGDGYSEVNYAFIELLEKGKQIAMEQEMEIYLLIHKPKNLFSGGKKNKSRGNKKNKTHKRKAKNTRASNQGKTKKPVSKPKSKRAKPKVLNKSSQRRITSGGDSYSDAYNECAINDKLNELKHGESDALNKLQMLRWRQRVARRNNATPKKMTGIDNEVSNAQKASSSAHRAVVTIREEIKTNNKTPPVKNRSLRAVFNRLK